MTDLFVSEKLYNPDSAFALFFSAIGKAPALIAVIFAAAALMTFLPACKLKAEAKKKLLRFALHASLTLFLSAATVLIVKRLWGRIRYSDLTDTGDFTPWYIRGTGGGSSFPSGHAAMAALIFLCYDAVKYFDKKFAIPTAAICLAFTLSVAAARIISGAHYLSDVIAGILITLAAKAISGHMILKKGNLKPEDLPRSSEAYPQS